VKIAVIGAWDTYLLLDSCGGEGICRRFLSFASGVLSVICIWRADLQNYLENLHSEHADT
jgi:hypothetical protein